MKLSYNYDGLVDDTAIFHFLFLFLSHDLNFRYYLLQKKTDDEIEPDNLKVKIIHGNSK